MAVEFLLVGSFRTKTVKVLGRLSWFHILQQKDDLFANGTNQHRQFSDPWLAHPTGKPN